MASLPPGWEPDYDGSRWLYRYTPTGLTQFTFPKPGDEFPEFITPGAGPISLAPEERLASEKQVKLRKKGIVHDDEASKDADRDAKKDNNFVRTSATGYFDPSEFMYYGGGDDDGELTPIAGKDDNQPKYPLGFVAELPSSDTILCAEELAPVELDAGPYESTTTNSRAEKQDDPLITKSMPHFNSTAAYRKPLNEDDIYSAGATTKIQSNLNNVSHPPEARDIPHEGIESSAGPVNTRQFESSKPQSSLSSIAAPIAGVPADARKPTNFSESHRAVSAVPLVSISSASHPAQSTLAPGRSVDDIRAMPSSLQAHQPPTTRLRSKSATHEPWRPSIKFVQTGLMQESQVSTPALNGSFALQQQSKDPRSVEDTRMSAWLLEQALARPPSKAYEAGIPDLTSSSKAHPEALRSVQDQDQGRKRRPSALETSDVDMGTVGRSGLLPPLPLARESSKNRLAEQADNVVETIIDVSAMGSSTTARGVQLVDVSPRLSRPSITRRGAMKKKRFSWESEPDDPSDEVRDDSTAPAGPTPSTPKVHVHRKQSSVPNGKSDGSAGISPLVHVTSRTEGGSEFVGRHQDQATIHPSARASPLASPRLPFETSPPTRGQIRASKVVVIEPTEERKASIATFEAVLRKPLPPLPLVPNDRVPSTTTSSQPKANAFEQMSELIAVANAAMPSARPRSAIPPGPSAESVWRDIRMQTSRSALSPNLTATSSDTPSTATLNLPNRTAGHARSVSHLTGPNPGLKPPGRHHSRSQSLMSASEVTTNPFSPPSDSDCLPQALSGDNTAWPRLRIVPAPDDGHKSHKRLSIHTTPAGVFQYHPLRSSPVFVPTSDEPETHQPHPVDYIKEQTLLIPQPPKPKDDRPSRSSRAEQPRLHVKPPFVGLPSSPRPSRNFQPKQSQQEVAKSAPDETSGEVVIQKTSIIEKTSPVTQRRPSTHSQVSSPTSSIFSSMRDSSISATSSMEDPDAAPLSDLGSDTDKTQLKCDQDSHPAPNDEEETSDHMPIEAAENHTVPSTLSHPPSESAQAKEPQTTTFPGMSGERPRNVPEAVRPAGTRASLWAPTKTGDDPADQPLIPTVVVRAPTLKKLRYWERQDLGDKQPPVPPNSELPLASPKLDGQNDTESTETPAQPVFNIVQSDDDVEKAMATPTKSQGFMQSLRKSWQFTTSNAPRLSLFAGQGHTRSRSQSALPAPHGKVGEAVAMAAKQAVMPWQWSDRENWPSRDSLPVDTGSISNVGATIRFFNSSFQARRSPFEDMGQPGPESLRRSSEDDLRTSTVVVRKVGPPVVVRLPSS